MQRVRRRRRCWPLCTAPRPPRPDSRRRAWHPGPRLACPRVASPTRMATRHSLGRQFGWLWAAYAVSTFGTWLAFDAFPLIAILVLHAGPGQVSVLAAAGLAGGAAPARPPGPRGGVRPQRPVVVAMGPTRVAPPV